MKINFDDPNEVFNSISPKLPKWMALLFYKFENLQNEKSLYYYTDMQALVNGIIVPSPEKGREICLWATKYSHLNDRQENKVGLNLLHKMSGKNDSILNLYRQSSDHNHSISFSRNRDYLPMWSMYGAQGGGVMLEFDTQALLKQYWIRLMPCVYLGTDYFSKVSKKLSSLNIDDDFEQLDDRQKNVAILMFAQMFISVVKNSAFSYENEVRIVEIGNPSFPDGIEREEYYRVKNGILVPFMKEYLPKSCLKAVWLGPTANKELSKSTLQSFLESRNIAVTVKCSSIPYRG